LKVKTQAILRHCGGLVIERGIDLDKIEVRWRGPAGELGRRRRVRGKKPEYDQDGKQTSKGSHDVLLVRRLWSAELLKCDCL
jgi:hypothetical protein